MIVYGSRASAVLYNYLRSTYKIGYYLLPVNVCPIVPITFQKLLIPFRFVDINEVNLCIDQNTVLEMLSDPDCTGLLFVNSYGIPQSFDSFFKEIKQHRSGFTIIEDKCLSPPSFDEKSTSPYADLTLYSTGYSKYLDIGYGGFGILKGQVEYQHFDLEYVEEELETITQEYKAALIENRALEYKADKWLVNNEFSEAEKDQYRSEVEQNLHRIKGLKARLNSIYENNIPSKLHFTFGNKLVSEWRFLLRMPDRDAVLEEIFKNNLFASAHYQPLNHLFPEASLGEYPKANELFQNVLNLFNDRYYTEEKALATAQVISKFFIDQK